MLYLTSLQPYKMSMAGAVLVVPLGKAAVPLSHLSCAQLLTAFEQVDLQCGFSHTLSCRRNKGSALWFAFWCGRQSRGVPKRKRSTRSSWSSFWKQELVNFCLFLCLLSCFPPKISLYIHTKGLYCFFRYKTAQNLSPIQPLLTESWKNDFHWGVNEWNFSVKVPDSLKHVIWD